MYLFATLVYIEYLHTSVKSTLRKPCVG